VGGITVGVEGAAVVAVAVGRIAVGVKVGADRGWTNNLGKLHPVPTRINIEKPMSKIVFFESLVLIIRFRPA
jgi:hypothetical protein